MQIPLLGLHFSSREIQYSSSFCLAPRNRERSDVGEQTEITTGTVALLFKPAPCPLHPKNKEFSPYAYKTGSHSGSP